MMHEMTEGIEVKNEATGQVGTALEYSYSSVMVYRYAKCPDVVRVRLADGTTPCWSLSNCTPHRKGTTVESRQ